MKHITDPALGEVCGHCAVALAEKMTAKELIEAAMVVYGAFELEEDTTELLKIGAELNLLLAAKKLAEKGVVNA